MRNKLRLFKQIIYKITIGEKLIERQASMDFFTKQNRYPQNIEVLSINYVANRYQMLVHFNFLFIESNPNDVIETGRSFLPAIVKVHFLFCQHIL